ncbi:hypothetical protein AQUCO_04500036v1 [Aquilegia coerulea]|uniref:Uncharacterized protein n=1 Tax=Aquilegia coerulea TaxID=218851 RepID=A0A2G5CLV4_AQUCA|nr:hypothetical protein AQUCO_04500036v1 [Aquilegia coerulea]
MVKSHAISCRKCWGRPVSLKSEMHIDNNKLDFPSFESKKETACSSLIRIMALKGLVLQQPEKKIMKKQKATDSQMKI